MAPWHPEPAQLLAAAVPHIPPPATQAGSFPPTQVQPISSQAGLAHRAGRRNTHQGQAAGADGWVDLGCQEAAASSPRENFKICKLPHCHPAKSVANCPEHRVEQSNKITLQGSVCRHLPYLQVFINSLQLRLRL